MTRNTLKVLVVVDGGMAYAYSEPGVQVAIADLDSLREWTTPRLKSQFILGEN